MLSGVDLALLSLVHPAFGQFYQSSRAAGEWGAMEVTHWSPMLTHRCVPFPLFLLVWKAVGQLHD